MQMSKLSIEDVHRQPLRRLLKERRLKDKVLEVPFPIDIDLAKVVKFGSRVPSLDSIGVPLKDAISRNREKFLSMDSTNANDVNSTPLR
jgi:hypothetical protein